MAIDVPNPIYRQEQWFRYIAGVDTMPEGGAQNRLEEWYVWLADNMMPISGGTMTGDLDMDGHSITGLPVTTTDSDAVSYGQVVDMIEATAGIYRGAFATYAALTAVAWQTTDPTAANYVTNNDWAVVLADENHSNECWRYGYTVGVGWQEQFKINDTPMSQAQWDAINSGATAAIINSVADKAPIASPALTGTPTAPTATAGTNTTQIATTAFVATAITNAIDGAIGGSY